MSTKIHTSPPVKTFTTSPLVKTYTLEEFWQLPEPPDRSKLELIAGVLFMSPPPEYSHDDVVTRLNRALTGHLIKKKDKGKLFLPRAAIWTGARTYLEPDLFYVSAELAARLDPKRRDTADLVVEVVSPGSTMYDRTTKADTYGALGVRELWLIDETARTVEVRRQTGTGFDDGRTFSRGERVKSAVFPALKLRVEQLFED
ncbi:MAG TPA: Uma2 family endonuclease [Pyrinomonadaceae bacterium]|jgi:Uma2 family endonuclease|nr:Uma2 family endonuclease [Pyrinomonadaceae bacterium]